MATSTARSATYRGFSTAAQLASRGKSFSTIDIETVKRDLLNHIYTIPGERPMMPKFGTRIPLLAFEPMDQQTLKVIEEDLRAVFEYDPRVKLLELSLLPMPDNNAILVLVDVQYVELQVAETMKLEFKVGS